MQYDWQKKVHSGHKVVDRNGRNIGTIRNVQQQRTAGGAEMGGRGYAEVACSLASLPTQLYIPFDQFKDCTTDTCHLNLTEDELKNKGWDRRPSGY